MKIVAHFELNAAANPDIEEKWRNLKIADSLFMLVEFDAVIPLKEAIARTTAPSRQQL